MTRSRIRSAGVRWTVFAPLPDLACVKSESVAALDPISHPHNTRLTFLDRLECEANRRRGLASVKEGGSVRPAVSDGGESAPFCFCHRTAIRRPGTAPSRTCVRLTLVSLIFNELARVERNVMKWAGKSAVAGGVLLN